MRHGIHLLVAVPEVVTTNGVNVRGSRAGFVVLIVTSTTCHFLRHTVNVSGCSVSDVISSLL